MNTDQVAAYLDQLLRTGEVADYPNAFNGLQVMNSGRVSRLAAAVDASEQSIRAAAAAGCDFLLVHHGLFWDGPGPVTGRRYRRLKLLLDHDMAVYASHLPLDLHPELGNNVLLARALGLDPSGTFGVYQGTPIGIWAAAELGRNDLHRRLERVLGTGVKLIAGAAETVRRVGIVTGGAGGMINAAVEAGLDTFITGEGAHHTYFDAVENGINVYYGGHYATETFGVRALAAQLSERLGIPWQFFDLPTGL